MKNIFTTSEPIGVTTRDLVQIVGALIALLGTLGFLDDEQRAVLTEQAPILMTALGTVIAVGVGIYRNRTKSASEKADAAAKEIDAKLPKGADVEIVTPGKHNPNIKVSAPEGE